jgi:hypothetical protein
MDLLRPYTTPGCRFSVCLRALRSRGQVYHFPARGLSRKKPPVDDRAPHRKTSYFSRESNSTVDCASVFRKSVFSIDMVIVRLIQNTFT